MLLMSPTHNLTHKHAQALLSLPCPPLFSLSPLPSSPMSALVLSDILPNLTVSSTEARLELFFLIFLKSATSQFIDNLNGLSQMSLN